MILNLVLTPCLHAVINCTRHSSWEKMLVEGTETGQANKVGGPGELMCLLELPIFF